MEPTLAPLGESEAPTDPERDKLWHDYVRTQAALIASRMSTMTSLWVMFVVTTIIFFMGKTERMGMLFGINLGVFIAMMVAVIWLETLEHPPMSVNADSQCPIEKVQEWAIYDHKAMRNKGFRYAAGFFALCLFPALHYDGKNGTHYSLVAAWGIVASFGMHVLFETWNAMPKGKRCGPLSFSTSDFPLLAVGLV